MAKKEKKKEEVKSNWLSSQWTKTKWFIVQASWHWPIYLLRILRHRIWKFIYGHRIIDELICVNAQLRNELTTYKTFANMVGAFVGETAEVKEENLMRISGIVHAEFCRSRKADSQVDK